jgi:hypothetical protein
MEYKNMINVFKFITYDATNYTLYPEYAIAVNKKS